VLTERDRIARQATLWRALHRVLAKIDSSSHEYIDMEVMEAQDAARELAADAEERLKAL
jgi:hypothetical protein